MFFLFKEIGKVILKCPYIKTKTNKHLLTHNSFFYNFREIQQRLRTGGLLGWGMTQRE